MLFRLRYKLLHHRRFNCFTDIIHTGVKRSANIPQLDRRRETEIWDGDKIASFRDFSATIKSAAMAPRLTIAIPF
jgi:hypothetical protein